MSPGHVCPRVIYISTTNSFDVRTSVRTAACTYTGTYVPLRVSLPVYPSLVKPHVLHRYLCMFPYRCSSAYPSFVCSSLVCRLPGIDSLRLGNRVHVLACEEKGAFFPTRMRRTESVGTSFFIRKVCSGCFFFVGVIYGKRSERLYSERTPTTRHAVSFFLTCKKMSFFLSLPLSPHIYVLIYLVRTYFSQTYRRVQVQICVSFCDSALPETCTSMCVSLVYLLLLFLYHPKPSVSLGNSRFSLPLVLHLSCLSC